MQKRVIATIKKMLLMQKYLLTLSIINFYQKYVLKSLMKSVVLNIQGWRQDLDDKIRTQLYLN